MWFISSIGVINYINLALIKDTLQSFVLHTEVLMSQLSERKIIFR